MYPVLKILKDDKYGEVWSHWNMNDRVVCPRKVQFAELLTHARFGYDNLFWTASMLRLHIICTYLHSYVCTRTCRVVRLCKRMKGPRDWTPRLRTNLLVTGLSSKLKLLVEIRGFYIFIYNNREYNVCESKIRTLNYIEEGWWKVETKSCFFWRVLNTEEVFKKFIKF